MEGNFVGENFENLGIDRDLFKFSRISEKCLILMQSTPCQLQLEMKGDNAVFNMVELKAA